MHKSIIFLLGFLVILLPFGSSMSNQNANAITENEYYTDQYMGYTDDMVNYYEDESSYANDGYGGSEQDRSSYGNNNYDREYYPSYKQDYNDEYKSYENNNDYKSKDKERSNSVSISKINCNTVNYNFNNVAIGNFSNGNSGIGGASSSSSSADGTNGALNANANGNNQGYSNGYQKDKDNTCITNINNNNTNIATGDDGNATNGNGNEILTCEECFTEILTSEQIADIEVQFSTGNGGNGIGIAIGPLATFVSSFEEFCNLIISFDLDSIVAITNVVNQLLEDVEPAPTEVQIADIVECIIEALGIIPDEGAGSLVPSGLSGLPLTTGSGLSNLPTIAQGIGDSPELTATEKITKLKTQWLNQLQ